MTAENLGAAGGGLLKLDRLEIAPRSVDGVELGLSRGRPPDRTGYRVSASLEGPARPGEAADGDLPSLLHRFDEREILHVTFGSALGDDGPKQGIFGLPRAHPEANAARVEAHLLRHPEPFAHRGPARDIEEAG